ncbi:hypothetical protein [Rhizobium leguminosarum]|uniref:hypothetical protein n=1 Tax=Rhizobium TaxID=379 RepID=UPI0021BC0996|nr:hypothetical protein [Rhizobium leguminosarum]
MLPRLGRTVHAQWERDHEAFSFVRPAAAVVLPFAFTSTDVIAKGKHRSCAQLQAMMDNALTGGKHAGDGDDNRAKIERKMRKKGC